MAILAPTAFGGRVARIAGGERFRLHAPPQRADPPLAP